MAICDIYTVSASLTVSATAITPILQLNPAATKRAFVVGIRVSIGTTAAAAGNNTLFTLSRNTTTTSGGAAGTALIVANDSAAAAALSTASNTWSITPPTSNAVVWQMELPQTTGSSWEEFPPLGYEWAVPVTANNGICVFVTNSVSTATPCFVELVFGE